ncbi:MAG: hypothetical protein HYZ31_05910 [Gammaproteobacteria bacterium]|nr:hypothetical protein [Gammaproteobacteria bacterium]
MRNLKSNNDQTRFEMLVASMNIPQQRKTCKPENVRWFLRNGAILNMSHKNIHAACALAQKLA